jgi:hypothetical protein
MPLDQGLDRAGLNRAAGRGDQLASLAAEITRIWRFGSRGKGEQIKRPD